MEMEATEVRPETVEDFYTHYAHVVTKAAHNVHRKFGDVEAEDLEQLTWERVLKQFDQAFAGQDSDTIERRVYRLCRNVQNQESLDYMYFSGHYLYSPQEVRLKLASCTWNELDQCPDVDARIDLEAAFLNLPTKQRIAVYKRFCLKEPYGALSRSEQVNEGRGVEGITHWLNRRSGARSARLDEPTEYASLGEELTEPFPDGRGKESTWLT